MYNYYEIERYARDHQKAIYEEVRSNRMAKTARRNRSRILDQSLVRLGRYFMNMGQRLKGSADCRAPM